MGEKNNTLQIQDNRFMDSGLKQTQQKDILSHIQLPDIWLSKTLDCAGSRHIYLSHLQTGQDWGHEQQSERNLRFCLLALYLGMQLSSAWIQFLMLPDPYSVINNQKYSLQNGNSFGEVMECIL